MEFKDPEGAWTLYVTLWEWINCLLNKMQEQIQVFDTY